ncbi:MULTISPECIES: phage tail tape measure protein [unclassified Paenibacillus]|uniref:phage tail tape measure protein n=1 Tax=unclassified Paenibacillus TaxID=185978 RepID=UPI0030F561AA
MAGKTYKIAFELAAKLAGSYTTSMTRALGDLNDLEEKARRLNSIRISDDMVRPLRDGLRHLERDFQEIRTAPKPTGIFTNLNQELKEAARESRQLLTNLQQIRGIRMPGNMFGNDMRRYLRDVEELERRMRDLQNAGGPGSGGGGPDGGGGIGGAAGAIGAVGLVGGAALAGAAAFGAAGVATYNFADEYSSAMAQIKAATGASAGEMDNFGKVAQSLYNQGLGEGFYDLAQSISIVRQVTKQTGAELEDSTKYAIAYADTFGEDITQSIKAADTMVKNFGITSEQAYNLLAQGAQKGLNKSDELIDTANEYAPYFAKLGFSADQMFDIFAAGLEAGAFNLDKVGDGIKEFGIRTKDGSKASLEAYKAIGLNGQEMTKQFAEGGVTAQKAFLATVKAINSISDAEKKNAVSVQLFGTQAEDLEERVIKAYGNVQKQFDMTKATMEEITEIKYSTIGKAFSGIGRQLQTTFLLPLSQAALPLLQKFSNWFQVKIPVIQGFFSKMGGFISATAGKIGGKLQPAFEKALSGDFVGAGLDIAKMFGLSDSDAASVQDTIGSVFADLKGISGELMGSFKSMAPTFQSIFGSIGDIFKQILPIALKVGATLYKVGTNILKGIMPAVQYISSKLWPIISKVFGFIADDIAPAVSRAFDAMLPTIVSVSSKVGSTFMALFNFVKPVIDALVGAFNFAFPTIKAVVLSVIHSVSGIFNGLMTTIGGVLDFITGVFTGDWGKAWQGVVDVFDGIFSALVSILKVPINAVIGLINQVFEKIGTVSIDIPDWVPGFGGKTLGFELPQIPLLAAGGVTTGPTLAMIGEGAEQEAVLPLSKLESLLGFAGGAGSGGSGGGDIYVDFAPQITIQGGGDSSIKEQVRQGVAMTLPELERMLQQLANQRKRVSFS